MIPLKLTSVFKYSIDICAELFDYQAFEDCVIEFNQYWFTVKANYEYELGSKVITVVFSHTDKNICESAAIQFVSHVRQFDWWREI